MLGSKIGRRGPALLVESGRLLGFKCQTGPQRVRQWASKGPSSNPKLEAELDPNWTKLKPDGAQSGDLDDLCHRVQVRPMTHERRLRGPLDPNAMAQGTFVMFFTIRNALLVSTPYVPPAWIQFSAQVGPKWAPKVAKLALIWRQVDAKTPPKQSLNNI